MSIAFWCILVAGLIPLLATGVAKAGGTWAGDPVDNSRTREWQARQTGFVARAHAAHLNGFEAFPFFAAAVLMAEYRGGPSGAVNGLALAFIAARIAYVACYLADRPSLRSLCWFAAFACAVAIMTHPAWG